MFKWSLVMICHSLLAVVVSDLGYDGSKEMESSRRRTSEIERNSIMNNDVKLLFQADQQSFSHRTYRIQTPPNLVATHRDGFLQPQEPSVENYHSSNKHRRKRQPSYYGNYNHFDYHHDHDNNHHPPYQGGPPPHHQGERHFRPHHRGPPHRHHPQDPNHEPPHFDYDDHYAGPPQHRGPPHHPGPTHPPYHGGPNHNGRHNGPHYDGPHHDGPRHDRPHHDGPRHDGPHHDGPFRDGSRHDGPHRDGPRQDGPHRDGPRQDGPHHDGPYRDGPHHDRPHHDEPDPDGSRHDSHQKGPNQHFNDEGRETNDEFYDDEPTHPNTKKTSEPGNEPKSVSSTEKISSISPLPLTLGTTLEGDLRAILSTTEVVYMIDPRFGEETPDQISNDSPAQISTSLAPIVSVS